VEGVREVLELYFEDDPLDHSPVRHDRRRLPQRLVGSYPRVTRPSFTQGI
jgi:hypothetical protein